MVTRIECWARGPRPTTSRRTPEGGASLVSGTGDIPIAISSRFNDGPRRLDRGKPGAWVLHAAIGHDLQGMYVRYPDAHRPRNRLRQDTCGAAADRGERRRRG